MQTDFHHLKIREQFAQRIATYERAANWMLSPKLIELQRQAAGRPSKGRARCLDLCCGTGVVGRNLLDLGWQVEGLDVTPEMARVAEQYFPVHVGTVENMGLPASSFDLAILRQSFMLVDGAKALREIHRILKPGGRFVLIQSVCFSDADDAIYEQVQRARHINLLSYYRCDDLTQIFGNNGFTVVTQRKLAVRESVDRWLNSAPELANELRQHIRGLIAESTSDYKRARQVEIIDGELFENWNWYFITGVKAH